MYKAKKLPNFQKSQCKVLTVVFKTYMAMAASLASEQGTLCRGHNTVIIQ